MNRLSNKEIFKTLMIINYLDEKDRESSWEELKRLFRSFNGPGGYTYTSLLRPIDPVFRLKLSKKTTLEFHTHDASSLILQKIDLYANLLYNAVAYSENKFDFNYSSGWTVDRSYPYNFHLTGVCQVEAYRHVINLERVFKLYLRLEDKTYVVHQNSNYYTFKELITPIKPNKQISKYLDTFSECDKDNFIPIHHKSYGQLGKFIQEFYEDNLEFARSVIKQWERL